MRITAASVGAAALAGFVLLTCHTAPARVADWRLNEASSGMHRHMPPRGYVARRASGRIRLAEPTNRVTAPVRYAFEPGGGREFRLASFLPAVMPPFGGAQALSPAEWRVSMFAAQIGDRDYLMVDKNLGRLIQFANGVPVFVSRALTGESLADRLPAGALSLSYAEAYGPRYRVTPAGRFTVSHGYDREVGATLDINEIRGRDWWIAIHSIPTASRYARLWSPYDEDKHVTEGCINVDANTMRRLASLPFRRGRIPLYILPMDQRLISQLF